MNDAVYVHHPDSLKYIFHQGHPFDQRRLVLTMELLQQSDALPAASILTPDQPLDEELLHQIHIPGYIEAVKQLSVPDPSGEALQNAAQYGLDHGDNPYFPGMHESAAAIAAGSVKAADLVMSGASRHALHMAGGLHHAMPQKSAGFCVYNDAALAITHLRQRYDARVLYIDTDVHHGDGVEICFYTDPHVFTYSIHETGKYLFPGTGLVEERGAGEGFGFTLNVPVEPYTEDTSWLECFENTLTQVMERARPDIIISQHGCDAHALDPLSHIHCSMEIYRQMPRMIHEAAHTWCEGRWVALGGGGYDIWRVVPRAWSLVWLEMSGHPLLEQINRDPLLSLPASWLQQWQGESPVELPTTWLDNVQRWEPIPRREEITRQNRYISELAASYLK
ncbi:acetoin utilization protein AcuC [Paenibacillus wulumuqiensis]|uniref:acetoin utilization protein AcuC n=1 Tax=Paenibacillus wulumuqiensis TaxID=1567107 RepID=UPI000AF4C0CF|nr:acetoin utilization protein AcuC [Paenibacillus wulumuqiensis]